MRRRWGSEVVRHLGHSLEADLCFIPQARKAEQDRLEAERLEQERLLAEKEEQERLEREERERQNKQQSKAELKAAAKEKWETLPEPDGAGTTKLSVRLPSGARVMRRFRASDTMEVGADFSQRIPLAQWLTTRVYSHSCSTTTSSHSTWTRYHWNPTSSSSELTQDGSSRTSRRRCRTADWCPMARCWWRKRFRRMRSDFD